MVHVLRLLILCLPATLLWAADKSEPFEILKERMASSGCNHLEFLSLLESQVFDTTDTVMGEAWLGDSGRYNVKIGPDQYLAADNMLYSYSIENNQVTVEQLSTQDRRREQLSFLTNLDGFYSTTILARGREYRLRVIDTTDTELPSPLHLFLNSEGKIDYFEYHDQNEDLNRIVILRQEILDSCPSGIFSPDFPDSVEIVRF